MDEKAAGGANGVVVDDRDMAANYANFCRVNATPEEVILDFGLNVEPGGPSQAIRVSQRIVCNFYTAKRLLNALGMAIQRHENAFGGLELDIGKRLKQ